MTDSNYGFIAGSQTESPMQLSLLIIDFMNNGALMYTWSEESSKIAIPMAL